MGDTPYTLFGVIVRKDPRTLLRTLVPFTPVAVINGGEDQDIRSGDIVRPISVSVIANSQSCNLRLSLRPANPQNRRPNAIRCGSRAPIPQTTSGGSNGSNNAAAASRRGADQAEAVADPVNQRFRRNAIPAAPVVRWLQPQTTSRDLATYGQQTTVQTLQYPDRGPVRRSGPGFRGCQPGFDHTCCGAARDRIDPSAVRRRTSTTAAASDTGVDAIPAPNFESPSHSQMGH